MTPAEQLRATMRLLEDLEAHPMDEGLGDSVKRGLAAAGIAGAMALGAGGAQAQVDPGQMSGAAIAAQWDSMSDSVQRATWAQMDQRQRAEFGRANAQKRADSQSPEERAQANQQKQLSSVEAQGRMVAGIVATAGGSNPIVVQNARQTMLQYMNDPNPAVRQAFQRGYSGR